MLVAAAGAPSAMSFIFDSPLIAAVILIEATAIGGPRLRVVLVARAAGRRNRIARLARDWTHHRAHTKDYSLGALPLTTAPHLKAGEFGWAIALAIAVPVVTSFVLRGGLLTHRLVSRRQLLVLWPAIG